MLELDYYYHHEGEFMDKVGIPRLLFTHEAFQNTSLEVKVLYGFFVERLGDCRQNNWYEEGTKQSYILFTTQEVCDLLKVSSSTVTKIMGEMDGVFINRKRQGLGLPTKIYVKNFSTILDECKAQQNNTKVATQSEKGEDYHEATSQ